VATWIDYIVPGLRQRGWRVTVGLTEGIFHNVDAYLAAHPMTEVIRIRNRTGTGEGRVQALYNVIRRMQPDIVASANIPDVYAAVNRVKRKGIWIRAVMTLHALEVEFYEQVKRTASIDAVIATNRLACRLASSLGELENWRIYYAPYGVGSPRSGTSVRKEEPTPLRIGFIGRLENPQKRIDQLVGIVKLLDKCNMDYELLIAGSGPQENWLRSKFESHARLGKVQFLGALSGKQVEDLYPTLHTLLITSQWETGPIVAWEAMAHGVLVVTSKYVGSGLEGKLRHRENCLMYPIGNAEAAMECILASQNIHVRKSITDAAFRFVREDMSHQLSVNSWHECFTKIISQPIREPAPEQPKYRPAGRLDRLLGTRVGEMVRHVQRGTWIPKGPGEEWPHVSIDGHIRKETFWDVAEKADRPEQPTC
jgi:glycosyltransferase involved in cell wall biosynthesis